MALRIEVTTVSGKTCEIALEAESTILNVKEAVRIAWSLPIEVQDIFTANGLRPADDAQVQDNKYQVLVRLDTIAQRLFELGLKNGGVPGSIPPEVIMEAKMLVRVLHPLVEWCGRKAIAGALVMQGREKCEDRCGDVLGGWPLPHDYVKDVYGVRSPAVNGYFRGARVDDRESMLMAVELLEFAGTELERKDPSSRTLHSPRAEQLWSDEVNLLERLAGHPPVDWLEKYARLNDGAKRDAAACILERFTRGGTCVRGALMPALAQISQTWPGAMPDFSAALVGYLEAPLDATLPEALRSLFQLSPRGDHVALATALAFLGDSRNVVRQAVCAGLLQLAAPGDELVVAALLDLAAPHEPFLAVLFDALVKIAMPGDRRIVAALCAGLQDGDAFEAALSGLDKAAAQGDELVVAALLAVHFESPNALRLKDLWLDSLTKMAVPGDRRVVAAVIACLGHGPPRDRLRAVEALGQVALPGDSEAIAAAATRLEDPKAWIRMAAEEVIAKLADEAGAGAGPKAGAGP